MNRSKPYDIPHKGLRNALSQLQLLAGKTDFSNKQEVNRLHETGKEVFDLLNSHAADENDYTLASLEKKLPGASHHDVDDHQKLHEKQDKLEHLLADIHSKSTKGMSATAEGDRFYLDFSDYHGTYLQHIAEEERITQPLLLEYFTDEELAEMREKIIAKTPPEKMLTWTKYVVPAQKPDERVAYLKELREGSPKSYFEKAMGLLGSVMESGEFERLRDSL